jgi:sugar phosphate permease
MTSRKFQWKSRYSILSILFLTWIVSFIDRMAMPVAIPYIAAEFKLSPFESSLVMSVFFAGYAISQLPGGMLADRFGVRGVATVCLLWWSGFTALTGAASSFAHMIATRFAFGLGEGAFPAAAFKTIAVWFPKKERGTANAIMLAANTLGAAISPLIVVAIMATWGWRAVFYSLFLPGLVVSALFWIFIKNYPRDSKSISLEEIAEIEQDTRLEDRGMVTPAAPLRELMRADIAAYFLMFFFFDIAYWGFTTWLPTYLVKARGFSMMEMGAAASLPFIAGAVGRVFGGWISDRFFEHDRRTLVIITQIFSALFLYLTFWAPSVWLLLIFQTLAGLFVHVFLAAFWALPITALPQRIMGSASGLINTGGQIGGFVSPLCVGALVEFSDGSFEAAFLFLVGTVIISLLVTLLLPRFTRGRREEAEA